MATEPRTLEAAGLADPAFRQLVDAALDIITVMDRDGRILFISQAVRRVLGYEPATLLGRVVHDYFHPEDRERAFSRFRDIALETPDTGRTAVYRVRARDGSYRHLESLSTNRLDDPAIGGICMVARDVTDRLAAEEAESAVTERRRLVAQIARIGAWEWDPATNELFADEAVRDLARALPGQRWQGPAEFLSRFLPEDREPLDRALRATAAGQSETALMVRMPLPDGSLRWLYIHGQLMAPGPRGGRRVLGLIMDVTAQKRAEEQISQRDELLALASWGADLGVWTWYPAADRILNDRRSSELLGLSPLGAEWSGEEWNRIVHPDDLPTLQRREHEVVTGQSDFFEHAFRVQRKPGEWHWVLDRGRVSERDGSGRALRIVGVTMDFDAVKQREIELAEQGLRLELALSASKLGLWDYDATRRQLYVDERYSRITGIPADLVRDRPDYLAERLHPDDRQRLVDATQACLSGRSDTLYFEGRLLRDDRRLTWVRAEGFVARRSAGGGAERLIGTIADVTEQRRSEQLSRAGEEVAQLGSYEFDICDDRFYWSEGTYRMFEYPLDFVPARGKTRGLLAPGSEARMVAAFAAAREEGRPFDIEVESQTARGRRICARMIGRVESFEGQPVRVYGIVQDITERKRLELSLIEASNRERQRLGSELHDGLGQELTGISLLLQGLAQQVQSAQPALAEPFDRLCKLLSHAIGSTRALAHGLAPVSSMRGGLEAALRLMAERSAQACGIPVSIHVDSDAAREAGEVAGNHLFRIAQEAVNNAIRHAAATRISIRLEAGRDELTLSIEDDGRGIGQPGDACDGFGLRSMAFRAKTLNGTIHIGPRPGGGTVVRVVCPQPQS